MIAFIAISVFIIFMLLYVLYIEEQHPKKDIKYMTTISGELYVVENGVIRKWTSCNKHCHLNNKRCSDVVNKCKVCK